MPDSTHRLRSLAPLAWCICSAAFAQAAAAQTDTVRVGGVAVRVVPAGVDTIEVFNVENGVRTLSRTGILSRTLEQVGGQQVLRIVAEDGRTRTDASLDAATLRVIRFARTSAADSTTFALQDGCFTGWSDMPNQPRRRIQCVPAADRFASGALDAIVISALPLRSGWSTRVATFDAFGDITSYPIRVERMDTIRVGGRDYAAWRVERTLSGQANTGPGGASSPLQMKTIWWIAVDRARVLQEGQTVTMQGTTRETLRVLRNP